MEVAINRSMRCIEMPGNAGKNEQEYRLIETGDVLKLLLDDCLRDLTID